MVTHLKHPCQRVAADAVHCQVHMLKLHPRQLTNCSFSGGMRQLADPCCQQRCYNWGGISCSWACQNCTAIGVSSHYHACRWPILGPVLLQCASSGLQPFGSSAWLLTCALQLTATVPGRIQLQSCLCMTHRQGMVWQRHGGYLFPAQSALHSIGTAVLRNRHEVQPGGARWQQWAVPSDSRGCPNMLVANVGKVSPTKDCGIVVGQGKQWRFLSYSISTCLQKSN